MYFNGKPVSGGTGENSQRLQAIRSSSFPFGKAAGDTSTCVPPDISHHRTATISSLKNDFIYYRQRNICFRFPEMKLKYRRLKVKERKLTKTQHLFSIFLFRLVFLHYRSITLMQNSDF